VTVFLVEDVSDSLCKVLGVDKDNSLGESASLEDFSHKVNLGPGLALVLKLLDMTKLEVLSL
jgi:hypothetical protein